MNVSVPLTKGSSVKETSVKVGMGCHFFPSRVNDVHANQIQSGLNEKVP